ncbi:Calcium-transporting ATPase 1 [Pseudoclavibacter triregionum]|nr:Calcium-transporting ATPase 1 [Pseudoclavibacter triregionum]
MWHVSGTALEAQVAPVFSRELDDLRAELATDPSQGLAPAEAARRLAADGPNELVGAPPVPLWRKILAQFQDPLVYLLLVAVVISLVAWWAEGMHELPVDAIVIVVIVLANAALGFAQESRAEQAVAALEQMSQPHATVVRGGERVEIPAVELVLGDLLVLGEGDQLAADGRLVSANALRIAEASLTGESTAVLKHPGVLEGKVALGDRTNMVFRGTAVTQGTGLAIVTATGMDTEMGSVAELLGRTKRGQTPLEKEIALVGKTLGIAVILIAIIAMAAIWLTSDIRTLQDAVGVLLLGVSLAVAAVPEGIPAILSVVLSIGVQAMARRNAIVKTLSSVETLGSASVICTDKTGTLTKNEMTVQEVRTASGRAEVTGLGYSPAGEVRLQDGPHRAEGELVLAGAAMASDASLRAPGAEGSVEGALDDRAVAPAVAGASAGAASGDWEILGDPTEAALLVAERKLDSPAIDREARFERVGEVPFTSERKRMSTIHRDAEDERPLLVVKGAPDVVIRRSSHVRRGDEVHPLEDAHREGVLADVEDMSGQAMRTIGVAYRRLEPAELEAVRAADGTVDADAAESLEEGLVYLGTVGMIDPAREEAEQAVGEAKRAGIRVIMITGDHPSTALRIARDLGIADESSRALTGLELDELTDAEFADAVREVSVFARVAPEHKLRIVAALQAAGEIVAMTGDGANDAPALKAADIGVAMGITGTEVTKQAGAMILRDDNFATIVAAVDQGRVIFDNIAKFLRYLLSSNMGEVITVLFGVLFAGLLGLRDASAAEGAVLVVPLLATQILWINLVTDSGPALALGVDPETDDVMARPPRRPGQRVIDGPMWATIVLVGAVMGISALLTIDIFLPGGLIPGSDSLEVARTAGFTTLVFAQLFNVFSARSATSSAFRGMFANTWLLGAVALGAVLQFAVVEVPFLQAAFGTAPLDAAHWAVALAMASSVLWVEELRKLIVRATAGRGPRR